MKKYWITLTLFIFLLILFVGFSDLLSGFEKHSCEEELTKLLPQGYKLTVNKEWVKVYYANTDEPYKSWTISYSDGLIYEDGEWKSLYREPMILHVDMKGFIDSHLSEEGKEKQFKLFDEFK